MKFWHIILIGILIVTALAGCGGGASASVEKQGTPAPVTTDGSDAYASAVLNASYENALPVSSQLALGTLRLEETENAVTSEQAKALLPLWQAVQGGTLQSEAETNAVLKQIEGKMTSEQLTAIAAKQLTTEDLGTWAQEQGISMDVSPGALATRQAKDGGQGGFGQRGNLSEEERASMRATAEASGMTLGGRGFGSSPGQLTILTNPLVELLTRRAAG